MQLRVLRSFFSQSLGRVCKAGEVLDMDASWCLANRDKGLGEIVNSRETPGAAKLVLAGVDLKVKKDENSIFITGDKGHLGKPICKALEGYPIVGYDLIDKKDILDYSSLVKSMRGCNFVVHCAGIPHPNASKTFADYFNINVQGTMNVARAAAENGVSRFIYLSSGAYYGWDTVGKMTPIYLPIDEIHPPASATMKFDGYLDAYAQSKLIAEQILAWYGTNDKFQVVCLRLGPAIPNGKMFEKWSLKADREKTFWCNTDPSTCARAVKLAVEYKGSFRYDAFNIVEENIDPKVDVGAYLDKVYPTVPLIDGWEAPASLISIKKAKEVLGL